MIEIGKFRSRNDFDSYYFTTRKQRSTRLEGPIPSTSKIQGGVREVTTH